MVGRHVDEAGEQERLAEPLAPMCRPGPGRTEPAEAPIVPVVRGERAVALLVARDVHPRRLRIESARELERPRSSELRGDRLEERRLVRARAANLEATRAGACGGRLGPRGRDPRIAAHIDPHVVPRLAGPCPSAALEPRDGLGVAEVDPGGEIVTRLIEGAQPGLAGGTGPGLARGEQRPAEPSPPRVRLDREDAHAIGGHGGDPDEAIALPRPERARCTTRRITEQLLVGNLGSAIERARRREHRRGRREVSSIEGFDAHASPYQATGAVRSAQDPRGKASRVLASVAGPCDGCRMRAMLLCAGLSTRLGKLGAERPKPMLPVCGIPILAYGITNLVAHGVTDLVINTHHRGEVIRDELGDGRRFGARIQYIQEDVLLGTGGGLKHALPLLDPDGRDEPFLSINGKLIFDLDVTALFEAYRRTPGVLGIVVVRRVPDAKEWGAFDVRVDARGPHVVDMLNDGVHMFCGVHVTRPSVMARLPEGVSDSLRQGYLPWLRAGERLAAYEHADGYFAEHSTPERYLASNWALLDGTPLRHPPSAALAGIDPSARIDPTATIVSPVRIAARAQIAAGITVGPYAVVGENARVERSITRTVVWANAVATAGDGDAIVT